MKLNKTLLVQFLWGKQSFPYKEPLVGEYEFNIILLDQFLWIRSQLYYVLCSNVIVK